jgi:hypothetical protein
VPAQRDNAYDLLKVHDGPSSPDLAITDWSTCRPERLDTAQGSDESAGCASATGAQDDGGSNTVSLTIQNSE